MPIQRITHFERCAYWSGGECSCAKLRREMDECDDCERTSYKGEQEIVKACARHQMRTDTKFIPGNKGAALARDYWDEHEQAYGELQRLKADRRRQLTEQEFWRRYGIPGVHK